MLIQRTHIRTHKCFSVSLQSLWQTHTSVCWCAAEFKPTRTHTSPEIFWSNRVAINALTWQLCAACKKWKRDSFHAWPHGIGLSGWYSASCFCWENTRGIFGCLLISSESRAGRQGNTHFHAFVKWFPYTNTHAHTHTVHTHMLSSLHSPALISSWLSASCYSAGDDTHTRTPTHTNAHTYVPLRSLKSHSCFLPNHCSHKILTHIEWKLNKPRYLKAVGLFFRRNQRHYYLFSTLNTIVGHRRSVCGHSVLFFYGHITEIRCYNIRLKRFKKFYTKLVWGVAQWQNS